MGWVQYARTAVIALKKQKNETNFLKKVKCAYIAVIALNTQRNENILSEKVQVKYHCTKRKKY